MTTYLFPGQGSQIKGMGASLFDEFPEITAQADAILGYSIKALCLEDTNNLLNKTEYTQPALYVVNALSYLKKVQDAGKEPDYLAGHSLGEYNALQASGAMSFEQGLQLVQKRGELMSHASGGAMAAVLNMTEDKIKSCLAEHNLSEVDIANYNAPTQTVISGPRDAIDQAQEHFEEAEAFYVPLNTSGAFHSRHMASASEEFEHFLRSFEFSSIRIPVISNISAQPYEQSHIASNLVKQITGSVCWKQSMNYLFGMGESEMEELGVGDVLTKLALKNRDAYISEFGDIIVRTTPKVSSSKIVNTANNTTTTKLVERNISAITNSVEQREKAFKSLKVNIKEWNSLYPIGTKVNVIGYNQTLTTKTPAMLLFGHRGAIYLEGYNGYFSLDDVAPAA